MLLNYPSPLRTPSSPQDLKKNIDFSLWGKRCIVLPKWTFFRVLAHSANVFKFYKMVGNDIFIQQCLVTLNNSSQMESTFWPRGRKGKGALESSTEGTAISASKGFEATVEAVSLSSSPCCFARWRTALWKHFDIIQFLNTKNRNKTLEFETIEYNTVLWFQYI